MTGFLRNKNKGEILVAIYMMVAAMAVLAVATIYLTVNEYHMARRNMLSAEMYYLAEAGTEIAANALANKVANNETEPAGANDLWPDLCGQTTDFLGSGFTLDHTCQSLDTDTVIGGEGVISFTRHYEITSEITEPDTNVTLTVNQIIARIKTYTFQHAVFYTGDLEILPGRDMTLSGKVHSNEDIYIDSNGADLTVDSDYLYGAGDIYKKRKDSGNEMTGTVSIRNKLDSMYYSMREAVDVDPLDSDRPDWMAASQTRWGGTVKSGVHGVTTLAVPEVGSIQPDGYYAGLADVKLVNGQLYSGGVQLVEGVDVPAGTIVSNADSFYNHREDKWVSMTTIDVEKLAGWEEVDVNGTIVKQQNYPNRFPDNGLLYATRDDYEDTEQPGIRLVNGSKIESGDVGFTVVSNNPVYIQGDFNNIEKKPAAVICDAINFLSNNWDDANSAGSLSSRDATGTAINVAIISGIVPTAGVDYSGGLENLPRLHENWTGETLYIRGSFVVLWDSAFGVGLWAYGNDFYTAPNRDWDYDTDFNNSVNLPPFTPFAVETRRVAWWKS
ncbi:MAG: hypothetical protein WBC16_02655 [Candidatus Omnitrophota bacterium]